MNGLRRRNLSGIYIFDKFPDDEKRQPTCIEDCQQETRDAWLEKLDLTALNDTLKHLTKVLCDIYYALTDEVDLHAEKRINHLKRNQAIVIAKNDRNETLKMIKFVCVRIVFFADTYCIQAK